MFPYVLYESITIVFCTFATAIFSPITFAVLQSSLKIKVVFNCLSFYCCIKQFS